jgi:hypothetical protein
LGWNWILVADKTAGGRDLQLAGAIRPSAVGKKNWLFIGAPEAGSKVATFYTLIGSCLRLGLNPAITLSGSSTAYPPPPIKPWLTSPRQPSPNSRPVLVPRYNVTV